MTHLPLDDDNHPIPAMRPKSDAAHKITVTSIAARNSTGFNADTRVVSVYATGAVFLKFGDNTVTAANTDHYFPAGVYYDFAIGGGKTGQATHISAIRDSADCSVYISEKE